MKARIIWTVIVLIAVHWLNESAELLERVRPDIAETYIHPFISDSYEFPVKEGIKIKWWVKYCTDDVSRVTIFFYTAWVLWIFSKKLSMMFVVYGAYHCFDHFMLWYDYKQSHFLYWIEGVCNAASLLVLLINERQGGKLKSIV